MIERILETLISQWEWDIAVMSQPWMYFLILPILGYLAFFVLKWSVLTSPVWIPLSFVFAPFVKNHKE